MEVRNNDTGETYTISIYEDSYGVNWKIVGSIAYILLLIGLTIGTINVAKEFPTMLFVLIILDVFALVPFISYIFCLFTSSSHKEKVIMPKNNKNRENNKNENDENKTFNVAMTQTLTFWKYMIRFLGKYGYIMFYVVIVTYWVLYFCGLNNMLTMSLMFLCMYGMYYFPYLMFHRAKVCNSRFASIMGLASIYAGIIAVCVGLAIGGEAFATTAPVLLPTVTGIFAIFCLPIQANAYKKYGEGKGPLSLKTIFIILGVSLLIVAFVLTIISTIMNR